MPLILPNETCDKTKIQLVGDSGFQRIMREAAEWTPDWY